MKKKLIPMMVACAVAFAPVTNTMVSAQDNTTTVSNAKENSTTTNTTNDTTTNTDQATEYTKPKKIKGIKIRYKTTDNTKVYTGSKSTIKVENNYERVVLKGKQDGIKKINKKLKKYSKDFYVLKEGMSSIHAHGKAMCEERTTNDTYFYSGFQTVTYVGKKYVSVLESSGWYAGGVHNTMVTGHTFNLKTGNEVKKITRFTKTKDLDKLKKEIQTEVEKNGTDSIYKPETILNRKATKFNFYIDKDGSVKVCFDPYEIGAGGWYREYVVKGRLK